MLMTGRRAGWAIRRSFDCILSPDGKNLLSCAADETVTIWDAATGARLWQTAFGEHPALSVAFFARWPAFRCRRLQVTTSSTSAGWFAFGIVRKSCKPIADVRPPTGNAFSITFTPDGRSLVIATAGMGLNKFTGYIWDVASQQLRPINFPEQRNAGCSGRCKVSPDSRILIASCYQTSVSLQPGG